jgi:hypothetical protein
MAANMPHPISDTPDTFLTATRPLRVTDAQNCRSAQQPQAAGEFVDELQRPTWNIAVSYIDTKPKTSGMVSDKAV